MYEECNTCGSTEQESMLNHEGRCVPCQKVKESDGEIPVEVVMKLTSMAETRHPAVCNEDAPRFRQVLEQEGLLPVPQGAQE